MNGPDTDPLFVGLAAGDERSLVALYDRFAVRMYRAALRILGSREDAEDVVQDVFLATVRRRQRLGEVRDLAAYLFAALHRAAGRSARRRRRARLLPVAAANEAIVPGEADQCDHVDRQRLERAIGALPDEQREVLSLRIDGELTFAQIAQVMGVSLSTAASRYQYALKKLKTSLVDGMVKGESPGRERRSVSLVDVFVPSRRVETEPPWGAS